LSIFPKNQKTMKIHYFLAIFFLNISFLGSAQFGEEYHVAHTSTYSINHSTPADLDGDGDIDLIVCNSVGNAAWRENVGNGIFTAPQLISKNLADSDIGIGRDLDGDGDLDVLVSCKYGDKIVWFRNDGSANFGPEQLISGTEDEVVDIMTIDIDNDGDLDVASSSDNNYSITIFENDGTGQFSTGFSLPPSVIKPKGLSSSDVDNDGDLDIIAAIFYDKVVWYPNLGNGTFDSLEIISDSLSDVFSVATGDMDGDGFFDVVSASSTENTVVWYKNLGGGNFSGEQLIANGPQQVKQVITEDFDNDGDLDVIASSMSDSMIVWFENDGNGIFTSQQIIFQTFADVYSFCIDDFNNDGQKDICISGQNSNGRTPILSMNQGAGSFSSPEHLYNHSNGVTSVFAADLTGDGLKEILSTSNQDDEVCWYKNLGSGRWGKQRVINTIVDDPQSICAADLDGDGDLDIVSGGRGGNVYWYENFGNDSIGSPILLTANAPWLGNVHTADIDGDLDQDILFSTADNDLIGWFENLGGGTFGPEQTAVIINAVVDVWTADLDGDLDLDLLCSIGGSTNAVNWSENLGGGTFGPLQNIPAVVDYLRMIRAADLDSDGDLDIITVSSLDDKVAWHENLGGASFGPQQVLSLQANYGRSISLADIDGDGDPDIAVSSDYNANVYWIENLGGGSFSNEQMIGEDMYGCYFVVLDDMDADGDQDAVVGVWGNNITNKEDGVRVFANQDVNTFQARGKIYYDGNLNGTLDSLEQGLGFNPIITNPNLTFAYTYSDGDYFVNFSPNIDTTYELQPTVAANWMITSDSLSFTLTVDSSFTYIDSLQFGMYPTLLIDSVHSELVSGFPRCNDTINFTVSLNNYGTTLPSGVIHLDLADSLTFISASFVPDSIVGQNIYWHYDSIFFFSNNLYTINVATGSFGSVGIPLESIITTTVLNEFNALTFIDSTVFILNTVCAYDPNDKISDPVGIDSLGFIDPSTPYIDYTIRFQNTGNDTALVVRIEDQLDPNLEWSSINILAYSHNLEMDYYPNGQIEFLFNNIYLPDSSANFLGSQGFVKYRIYIDSNTTIGTSIYNTAEIYFDLNPAVVTNTKILTLYDCDLNLNNINDTLLLCEGEVLAIADIMPTTEFDWNITGVSSGISSEINWVADTAGVFQLTINKSNEFCAIDTIVNLDIKAQLSVQALTPIAICSGESAMIFGQPQFNSGVFDDTLNTIWGCDSIVSQELTVHPAIPIQDLGNIQICSGDSIQIFGYYMNASANYYDTLSSLNGCDSILMQSLMVMPSTVNTVLSTITICDGDSLQVFGSYISNSGIFTDSLQTYVGCDSIVSQELIVSPIIPIQDLGTTSICTNDSLLVFNEYISSAGIYYDTLQGTNSCDSIQMIEIELYPEVSVSFGTLLEDTICINHQSIILSQGLPFGGIYSGNGVANDEFDPNLAGIGTHTLSYTYTGTNNCDHIDQLQIVVDGCVDIDQVDWTLIKVYPNPADEELMIDFGKMNTILHSIEIVNIQGKKILEIIGIDTDELTIPIEALSNGTYIVNAKDASGIIQFRTKVIVNH
jgi:uncharacterized repeat protein (TIGR01451 family)